MLIRFMVKKKKRQSNDVRNFIDDSLKTLINNWQMISKQASNQLLTRAINGSQILTPTKGNSCLLVILDNRFCPLSPWLILTSKQSNSLRLVGLTFSADMELKDYIELIVRSAARKLGSLCCDSLFFFGGGGVHVRIHIERL